MAKNPLIRPKEKSYATPMPNQSAGILDDYAVRKVIHSKEGTMEQVPQNANDIVNKAYVDALTTNHPHQDVNTTASPTFDELTLNLGGSGAFNFVTTTISNSIGFQSATSTGQTRFGFYSKDGDGTDNVLLDIYAVGTPESGVGRDRLTIGFVTSLNKYLIQAGTVTRPLALQAGGANTDQFKLLTDGSAEFKAGDVAITAGDFTVSAGDLKVTASESEIIGNKMKMTKDGGLAILLNNLEDDDTIKGTIVCASASESDSFETSPANSTNAIGVVLDSGIESGEPAWIVVSGVADVLADSGGFEMGDRLIIGATAGRAVVSNSPSTAEHFGEIGHAIEDADEGVLGRVVLHFL